MQGHSCFGGLALEEGGEAGKRRVVCVLPGGRPKAPERECEDREGPDDRLRLQFRAEMGRAFLLDWREGTMGV